MQWFTTNVSFKR